MADLGPGDVVLDLGCGAGLDLLFAAGRVGPTGQVLGVDTVDDLIEAARANAAAAGLDNVDVRKGAIDRLPVVDASIDWVVSNCALHRSPDKPRAFAEIARVLTPGGRLRIADIVVGDFPAWVRHDERLRSSGVAGAIGETDFVAGLRDAGLIDVTLGGRYVYDRDQLAVIVAAEGLSPGEPFRIADALVGQVWFVHLSAAKPRSEQQES